MKEGQPLDDVSVHSRVSLACWGSFDRNKTTKISRDFVGNMKGISKDSRILL